MKSDGGCKNAAAAVNFRLKSLAEFFAAHGEKSIKYIFAEGVYLGKNTSRSESVEVAIRDSNRSPAKRVRFEKEE